MQLYLDENFHIETDSNNFILKFSNTYIGKDKKTNKDKEITSKDEWYFPKLSQALETYFNESLKRSDSELITDLYIEVKRVEALIKTIKN